MALVDPSNTASIRAAQKIGMRRMGNAYYYETEQILFRADAADFNMSTDGAEAVGGHRTQLPTSSMALASMVSLIYSPSLVHRHEIRRCAAGPMKGQC